MKILCIADAKDHILNSSQAREHFKDIDLILSAGDLDLEYYAYIVNQLNKPLIFVFGNHNLKHFSNFRKEQSFVMQSEEFIPQKHAHRSFGSIYTGGKVKKINGLIIAGLGGSKLYNRGRNQFTEIGMFIYALKLFPKLFFNKLIYKRSLDILLTHAPPFGINDKEDKCHEGFKFFLWFMKIFKPKLLIHGHIHLFNSLEPRTAIYKDTYIINAYKHFIVDTEKYDVL